MSLYSFHGRGTLNGTIPHPALVALFERRPRRTRDAAAAQRPYRRADRFVLCAAGRQPASPAIDLGFPMPLHAFVARGLRSRRPRRPDARCWSPASRAIDAGFSLDRDDYPNEATISASISAPSNRRACSSTATGRIVATASQPHKMLVPQPGWAEHRPKRGLVGRFHLHLRKKLLAESGSHPRRSAPSAPAPSAPACCRSMRDGEPLMNAVLYGVDTRAAREIEELTARDRRGRASSSAAAMR